MVVLGVPLGWADNSGEIRPFPLTGAYRATHREDRGHIAIIDFVGNYNKDLDTGESNVEARAVVAREFLRTHPDTYDFLVVFSTFEFTTGDALAFHWGVQNKVQGLGLAQYDVSHLFGSDGRLLGYIDMAALTRYVTDPIQPAFETVLTTLGHEMLHQWSGRARFMDAWTNRFAHPHLPRTLRHRLRNAGFRVLRCDVLVLLNDTYDPDTYSLTNGDIMAEFVQHHGLSAADVADWKRSLEKLGTQDLYFFSLNRYLFQATKP